MFYNTYEIALPPAEPLMKSLEAILHILAVIETSALVLIVILLAIIAWSGSGEFRPPRPLTREGQGQSEQILPVSD